MENGYKITAINKRTMLDAGGTFVNKYDIQYVTKSGVRDNLELDEKDYEPEKIKELLTAMTIKHEKIMAATE